MNLKINKIYNEDCFDFIPKIKDNSVDLLITDPPYNLKKASWDRFKSEKDFFEFTYRWLDLVIPKVKENGSIYVFNTPRNSAYILSYLEKKRELVFQNWICWDKKDGLSAPKRKYANGQETILFFTKGIHHIFNYDDIRVAYDSKNRIEHAKRNGIIKNGKRWFPNKKGKLCREIWNFSSERHKIRNI